MHMAERLPNIRFDYQPRQVGNEWHVIAIYPTGQMEAITGFKSEQEAKDWVNNDALVKQWLRNKEQLDEQQSPS
jgi:hypothetical protein